MRLRAVQSGRRAKRGGASAAHSVLDPPPIFYHGMDSVELTNLASLLLGWLLGLLSPIISDAIKRRRENLQAKQAMRSELHEVSYKLALAAHSIDIHQGVVTRQSLEWLKKHLEGYAGILPSTSILEGARIQLSWSDEQLQAYVAQTAKYTESLCLQKYGIPMIDSRVSALWSLENRLQRLLLEIRTGFDMLNDLVDRSRHYSDLTFTKLEAENRKRVIENLEQTYSEYAKRARKLVEQSSEARSLL